MGKRSKLTEKRMEIILECIRSGYTIVDTCKKARIGRSTYYKWLEEFPDFNKAMVEATDLQWKYATWRPKYHYRSYERNHLNRPSQYFQSPNNLPFKMPNPNSDRYLGEFYGEQ